jgi:hypothetical protein
MNQKLLRIQCIAFAAAFLTGSLANAQSSTSTTPSGPKSYSIEGISLVLPSLPDGPHLIPTSPKMSEIIKRQAGYQAAGEDCSVLVFHAAQDPKYPVSLDLAVSGALENMKKVPGTTDFTSKQVNKYPITGAKTSEIVIQLNQSGVPKMVQVLTIAKDNHLHQITIEGTSKAVEKWAAIVFPSIKISP